MRRENCLRPVPPGAVAVGVGAILVCPSPSATQRSRFDDGFDEAGLDVVDEARYDDRLVHATVAAERGDVHDDYGVGVVAALPVDHQAGWFAAG